LASLVPSLGSSAAPLGFRLATTPGAIVPIYPAGLPLMMAIALKVAGPSGVYYVVPLLSGLTVWLTYLIGTRVDGRRTGLLAAVLVACSPIFLLQSFEPMSDVPATAFWLLAIALAMSPRERGEGHALGAGLAASVAVLTRPNLAPLVVVVGLMVMTPQRPFRRGLLFAIGVIPGCVAVALIARSLYGSALGSGYGPVDTFFSFSHVEANLRTYPVWLLQLHSVFILLALASPFVPIDAIDPAAASPTDAVIRRWLVLCFGGLLFLCYVFYVPYDTWPFLRFLLPAIPLWLVLSSTVAVAFIARIPDATRGAAVLALCGLLSTRYVVKAKELNIFLTRASQQRYVAVGAYVDRELPPNAVVLTVIQSGSIRLYGHRATVRWDQLPADDLDTALAALESNGYLPYVLLESWEQSAFLERFAKASDVGRLRWPPALELDGFERVQIFSLQDRRLSLAGKTIGTKRITR
jgi:4-amino-4-deoxy-L-arabinose transferase-like glycosyltransferase